MQPGSSSENIKNPLFMSSVLGANILEVAVWKEADLCGCSKLEENNFSVVVMGFCAGFSGSEFSSSLLGCEFSSFTEES